MGQSSRQVRFDGRDYQQNIVLWHSRRFGTERLCDRGRVAVVAAAAFGVDLYFILPQLGSASSRRRKRTIEGHQSLQKPHGQYLVIGHAISHRPSSLSHDPAEQDPRGIPRAPPDIVGARV